MEVAVKKILCGNLGTTADRSKEECDGGLRQEEKERRKI